MFSTCSGGEHSFHENPFHFERSKCILRYPIRNRYCMPLMTAYNVGILHCYLQRNDQKRSDWRPRGIKKLA
uniref:Uncharacterized protein n=1 Tax=Arundo donax TaxID=35708 RepID=A0A0A9FEH3_ARUDO